MRNVNQAVWADRLTDSFDPLHDHRNIFVAEPSIPWPKLGATNHVQPQCASRTEYTNISAASVIRQARSLYFERAKRRFSLLDPSVHVPIALSAPMVRSKDEIIISFARHPDASH
jgi:hypothetical protein